MSFNDQSASAHSQQSNPGEESGHDATAINTNPSTNGGLTYYSTRVPGDAVPRYYDLMESMRSLRMAASEYQTFMDDLPVNAGAGTMQNYNTSLIHAMNTFAACFRRVYYGDVPAADREGFRYLQEGMLRRTFDHAITLRSAQTPGMEMNHVANDIMAVFRAYDEQYSGEDIVREEVEMLDRLYQAQLGAPF